MSEPNDGRLGEPTPYTRDRPRSLVAVAMIAVLLILAVGVYLAVFGTGYPTGASVPLR